MGEYVFDVTESTFSSAVVEKSMTTPVLLDFWAGWCGPCKQLTPVLEALAEEYAGGFVLGKVDTEAEVGLAQAFQVQSIPFVMLIVGGRPTDAFQGALGEAEVRKFLAQHQIEPAAGEPGEEKLVPADEACLAAAREAVLAGDLAAARDALSGFPDDESKLLQDRDNLEAGFAFLEDSIEGDSEAANHLKAAREAFLQGAMEPALEGIVASAAADRSFADGLARRAMLLCQAVFPDEEIVDDYRRRLATLLY